MFPADISRSNLKLAEVLENLRRERRAEVPPPPYHEAADAGETTDVYDTDELDEEDERPAPVSILVDTAIDIDGQGNTVVLPLPLTGPSLEEKRASRSASPQSPQQDSHEEPEQGAQAQQEARSNLQTFQQHRQAKSAQLMSAIITALENSGILTDKENGRRRPIEIQVNAGLRVRGERNVVCAGMPKVVPGSAAAAAAAAAQDRGQSVDPTPSEMEQLAGSKRRASMVRERSDFRGF
ncbi:hypothetical protein KEM55_007148 [Ascosphaera atra]|nr:hypothetical protein KEM55_007148 [Ascosphaera atra]